MAPYLEQVREQTSRLLTISFGNLLASTSKALLRLSRAGLALMEGRLLWIAFTIFCTWRGGAWVRMGWHQSRALLPSPLLPAGQAQCQGWSRAPRAGAEAAAGSHLLWREASLSCEHIHHVGSQLGAVEARCFHALNGCE